MCCFTKWIGSVLINTLGQCILRSPEYPHGMVLHWTDTYNAMSRWNEMLADITQVFGLPGDRYITDVNVNDMTFWFRDHRDALLFKLSHGHSELRQA